MPWPVAVLPLCPLACGSLLVRAGGELSAVIVIKATFALAHERGAWPIAPDPLVEVDAHVGGHPANALVAASDLTPMTPGAGVVVSGAAHAPGGRPTTSMAVRVAVFQEGAAAINKHLVVSGDAMPGEAPAPFTRMPITYERAYGGPGVAANPAGVGAGGRGPLPNVADPARAESPVPAGFGPIARTWAPRAKAMRAFDAVQRARDDDGEASVVAIPDGFDLGAFHAAPLDQRLEPLRGDEWIVLDGLCPDQPRIQTQLPFARAEARATRGDRRSVLVDVPLVADTLTIDAERRVASVVWRGRLLLASIEEAETLGVYVGLALPGLPIAWPGAPEAVARAPSTHERDEWPDLPDTTNERDVRAIRAQLGWSVGDGPPEADELAATAELDRRRIRPALPFVATAATEHVAPPAATAPDGPARQPLTGTGEIALDDEAKTLPFRKAPVAEPALVAPPCPPPSAGVAREALRRELAELLKAGASLSHLPLAGADLSGLDLRGADLSGARLEGADLSGADLGRANLDGARLDGTKLDGTKLAHARGEGASFVGARGGGASFARGQWGSASFADAELPEADFTGASLTNASLLAARLDGARFVDVRGDGATLEGARLGAAKATGAAFPNASFKLLEAKESQWEGAVLDGAAFDGAALEGASLFRVSAASASFAGADLRGANLQRASAAGADFTGALLDRADLRDADLTSAVLTGSSRRGAKLTGAKLPDDAGKKHG